MKSISPPRLEFVDGLKVVMLLFVLLNHIPQYIGMPIDDTFLEVLGGTIGVSGFVILSGFGLTYSLLSKGATDVKLGSFFWKRFSRIAPLYYVALFAAMWFLEVLRPKNLVTHLLFVHTFFEQYSRTPGSLWFVGLIAQCYLVFPLLYKLLQKDRGKLLLMLSVIALYGLSLVLEYLGFYAVDSFLRYGITFAFGMLLAADVQRKGSISCANPFLITLNAAIVIIFLIVFLPLFPELPSYLKALPGTITAISCFVLLLNGFLFLEKRWSSFQKLFPLLSAASFASYAAYLFHRPILEVTVEGPAWSDFSDYLATQLEPLNLAENDYVSLLNSIEFAYLFIISVPVIFFVSYWIQIAHDSVLKELLSRSAARKNKALVE